MELKEGLVPADVFAGNVELPSHSVRVPGQPGRADNQLLRVVINNLDTFFFAKDLDSFVI